MAFQAAVLPQANEIADEAGQPRIFVMLERLLLAVAAYCDVTCRGAPRTILLAESTECFRPKPAIGPTVESGGSVPTK